MTSQESLISTCLTVLRYDMRLYLRARMAWCMPLLFYIISLSVFAIALAPQPNLLKQAAPVLCWLMVLLASLLATERWLRLELQEGSLAQLCLSPQPLPCLLLMKVLAYWLLNLLPLIVLTPLLTLFFDMSLSTCWWLMLSLLLATPVVSLIGGVVGALTVALPSGGIFLALLLLPLYVPLLLFALGLVSQASQGLPVQGVLALLVSLLLLAVSLAPLAMAAALRVGVSQS